MQTDSSLNQNLKEAQLLQQKKSLRSRVKVAIRVRPLIQKQTLDGQSQIVEFPLKTDKEIIIGRDRNYKFDKVFKQNSHQDQVYQSCVKDLVMSCFQGYNSAILAYGQTGSGKTFTMGTSSWSSLFINSEKQRKSKNQNQNMIQNAINAQAGIIPRVINQIFTQRQAIRNDAQLSIRVSFIQIYNEQIIDLLSDNKQNSENIGIREQNNEIKITGVQQLQVKQPSDMISLLQKGGRNRATKKTSMNSQSSRSHAIFTIFMQKKMKISQEVEKESKLQFDSNSSIHSKFFLVDLAGSQRAKKTGATGKLLKEGININLGLLQLGNVISALSNVQKKQDQYITYRNSKLTRILKDCLGGNSNTYMIACVSPAESNFQESLNTLKYASKAMNIKNKPVINRDPITQLKMKLVDLQNQNSSLKKLLNQKGIKFQQILKPKDQNLPENSQNGKFENLNNAWDYKSIKKNNDQIRKLQKQIQNLKNQLLQQNKTKSDLQIKNFELTRQKDYSRLLLEDIKKSYPNVFSAMQIQFFDKQDNQIISSNNDQIFGQTKQQKAKKENVKKQKLNLIDQYLQQIQNLNSRLDDRQKFVKQLQEQLQKYIQMSKKDQKYCIQQTKQIRKVSMENILLRKQKIKMNDIIKQLKQELDKNQQIASKKKFQKKSKQFQALLVNTQNLSSSIDMSRDQSFDASQLDSQAHPQIIQHQKKQQLFLSEFSLLKNELEQKQDFLEKMNAEQISLQYQLLTEMKQQYHHKITLLQRQKQQLLKYTSPSNSFGHSNISSKDKAKYVTRIQNLQTQLKQFRKKVKQQKNLEKLVSSQNTKIKQLAQQIKKAKLQKMDLYRKIKVDKQEFQKFKTSKIKDLLMSKKDGIKKDRQIKKLQMENAKNLHSGVKKDQQLKRMKKINQSLKSMLNKSSNALVNSGGNSINLPNLSALNNSVSLPSSQQTARQSSKGQNQQQSTNKNIHYRQTVNPSAIINKSFHTSSSKNIKTENYNISHHNQGSGLMSQKDVDNLLSDIIKRMLMIIAKRSDMQKYQSKILLAQRQLEQLFNEQAISKLKIQRLKSLKNIKIQKSKENQSNQQDNYQQHEVQMQELKIKINDLYERIQSSQDNLQYCRQKIQTLNQQSTDNLFDLDSQILFNKKFTSSLDLFKKIVKSVFIYLHSCLQSNYSFQLQVQQKSGQIIQRQQQIQVLKQQIATLNWQHRESLQNLRQQMMQKYYKQDQQQESYAQEHSTSAEKKLQRNIKNAKTMDERQRIFYQSKINQLSKLKRQQSSEIDKLNKKIKVLQQKCDNATRKMLNFNKIRKNSQQINLKDNKKFQQISKKNEKMMGDINQIIQQFDHLKPDKIRDKRKISQVSKSFAQPSSLNNRRSIQYQSFSTQKTQLQYTQLQQQKNKLNMKWECVQTIDGHGSPISCLASYTNILISGGSKNLKIWDLQTNKMISDLSGLGNVRYLCISQQHRIILAACDKNILVWDLTTLQTVTTLKGHQSQIKSLTINDNFLFSGGKGSINTYSLLGWDMRNLGKSIIQKERNQDIQSMKSFKNNIYFGSINKAENTNQIRKLNCENFQISSAFENGHLDQITGLSFISKPNQQTMLLSSSKDQMIKVWSLQKGINKLICQKNTCIGISDKQNYPTSIQHNDHYNFFYLGYKDGSIKFGTTCTSQKQQKIGVQFFGQIKGHTKPVTNICPIEDPNSLPMIASGSSDKIIKIWKPTMQSVQILQKLSQY